MSIAKPFFLQALSLALLRLEAPLSADQQAAAAQIGEAIASQQVVEHDLETEILALVDQNPALKQAFDAAYDDLQKQYQSQERAKGLAMTIAPFAPADRVEETFNWTTLASQILIAADRISAAREGLKRLRFAPKQPNASLPAFFLSLQKTIVAIDVQETQILKALEKRPLTAEELVYAVGLPFERVQAIVQSLWNRGYIERTTSGFVYLMFPALRSDKRKRLEVDANTYLTLTARGSRFLHPLIAPSPSGVAAQ